MTRAARGARVFRHRAGQPTRKPEGARGRQGRRGPGPSRGIDAALFWSARTRPGTRCAVLVGPGGRRRAPGGALQTAGH